MKIIREKTELYAALDAPDSDGSGLELYQGAYVSRLRKLGLMLGAYTVLFTPAWSAEQVTIPAYAPTSGVEHVYRVQKATENDMSFWFDKPEASPVTMHGEFRQRMIVLSQDEKTMRMRWTLSADLPDGVSGEAASYQLNPLYQNSLVAYGVNQLDIETDRSGAPYSIIGADTIVENVEKKAASGPDGAVAAPQSGIAAIIDRIRANPLQIATALVPEATLLAQGQAIESEALELGRAYASSGTESIGGVDVGVQYTWTVESVDTSRHTAILALSQDNDPETLSQAQQAAAEKMIAAFPERTKNLTGNQLAAVKRASKNRTSRFVVSLTDGSVLEGLEIVVVTTGGMTLRTYNYIRREDIPASLQLPDVLSGKALNTPDLQVEPLSKGAENSGSILDKYQAPEAPAKTPQEDTAVATDQNAGKTIAPVSLAVASAKIIPSANPYGFALDISLTPESATRLLDFTRAVLGRQIQLLINDRMVTELWIKEPIMDGRITVNDGPFMKTLGFIADAMTIPGAQIVVRVVP